MAADRKKLKANWVTPLVTARFPSLRTLRTFQMEGKAPGKPRYECSGIINADDIPELKAYFKALGEKWFPTADFVKNPMTRSKKDPTEVFIKAHSGADYLVPIFDSKNGKLPEGEDVRPGDQIRMALALTGYEQGGIPGITAYLNQVQIVRRGEGTDRSKSMFGTVEDGFEATDEAHEAPKEVESAFNDSIDF